MSNEIFSQENPFGVQTRDSKKRFCGTPCNQRPIFKTIFYGADFRKKALGNEEISSKRNMNCQILAKTGRPKMIGIWKFLIYLENAFCAVLHTFSDVSDSNSKEKAPKRSRNYDENGKLSFSDGFSNSHNFHDFFWYA